MQRWPAVRSAQYGLSTQTCSPQPKAWHCSPLARSYSAYFLYLSLAAVADMVANSLRLRVAVDMAVGG